MIDQQNGGILFDVYALDYLNTVIMVLNPSYHVVFLNKAAKKYWGNIDGKIFEYKNLLPEKILNCEGEILIQETYFQYRWTTLENGYFLGEWTDISKQKKLELQFIRSQRMETLGLLASGIVHDLNNMLSPIFMGVGFLKNSIADSKSLSILTLLESSAKRGQRLTQQILSFARGADKKIDWVSISDLLDEVSEFILKTFPKNIDFFYLPISKSCHVVGNYTQLFQVFLNLAMNAKDAMPNGGIISIKVVEQSDTLEITFSDSGMGIPEDVIPQIFKPFFTTKNELGTGMGLSAVHSIIQNHKGKITVESKLNYGTKFKILMPYRIKEVKIK
jgi:signal transduction histidine kinase